MVRRLAIVTTSMSIIKTLSSTTHTQLNRSSVLKKLSTTDSEKVHLHFLKWALGVNRKASNLGTWGETGRYPLVFEAIRLTLKYVKRLKEIKNDSLVKLAFEEQVKLDLDWHRGVEKLLKLDPYYSVDHITAHHARSRTLAQDPTNRPSQSTATIKPVISSIPARENFLIHNGFKKRLPSQTIKPHGSKTFTPHVIMKSLKTDFKNLWLGQINNSNKLKFYAKLKGDFTKEHYLDNIKNFYDRASVSKIRISAHRLEIEVGRHNKTPKDERICTWCDLTMFVKTVEDEPHFLQHCDLYSNLRHELVTKTRNFLTTSTNDAPKIDDILYLKVRQPINQNAYHQQATSTYETSPQVHLDRLIGRFINKSLQHRENFFESLA